KAAKNNLQAPLQSRESSLRVGSVGQSTEDAMTHDERRIPLDYEPAATPQQVGFWKTMRELFLGRRNRQDAHRAKAVERNAADRRRDALRLLRQPGATPEQIDMALRVLGGGK